MKPEKAVFPKVNPDGTPFLEGEASDQTLEEEPVNPEEEAEALRRAEVEEELRQMLETARREADRLLMESRKKADEEYETAREAGYRAGYSTGYEESRRRAEGECRMEYEKQLEAFREDVKKALQSVETAKERCLRNYLDEIRQMIISATEKLKKTAWVKIYIDKSDYDMMMEADADVIDELSHLSDNIKFIVMDKEDTGNCIIEMPEEIVDVSVNTQIENIKDILENVRV